MKYLPPVIVGAAAIIVAVTTGLNQAFRAHVSLISYLIGYATALVLLVAAGVMAVVAANQERVKPRIVPVSYGRLPDGRGGLTLVNEGEPAYDLSVLNGGIAVGTGRLKFPYDISRLTKQDGNTLCEAWIEASPGHTLAGSDLFDQMRKNEIESVTVTLVYKDGDNRWYRSICRIERDVLAPGGIITRFVRQRRVLKFWLKRRSASSASKVAAKTPQISQVRGATELRDATLGERMRALADEILKFLEDVGPKPKPAISSSMTEDEILEADSEKIAAHVNKIHYTYEAKFKDRVNTILLEFAAEGLRDPELNVCINARIQTAENMKTIAERFLVLASRLPRS